MKHKVYTVFYRNRLNDEEKKVYDTLVEGLECWEKKIQVSVQNPASFDMKRVKTAVEFDNPQLYYAEPWGSNSYGKNSITIEPTYLYSAQEYKVIDREVKRETRYIEEYMLNKTEYEKVQEIHDRLVRRITYGKIPGREKEAHSIVGALKDYTCVCDGFAKLFKYIMDDLDVRCLVVFGDSYDPGGKNRGGHAWNIVRVNGKNYQIDVTWDRVLENKYVARAYFLLSDEEMRYDHEADGMFPLPKCAECYDQLRIVEDIDALIRAMIIDYRRGEMFGTYRLKRGFGESFSFYSELKKRINDARVKEVYSHIYSIWLGKKRRVIHVMWSRD